MQPEGNQVQPNMTSAQAQAAQTQPAAPAPQGQSARAARDQRASVQNHLLFSEIKDGIVMMRDGSLRMVIMASAINFDLKSPQEQDAIEFAYQGFLNGLHFPVQIVVRSRKIDLDGYLEKLEKLEAEQDNQLLAGLMEDYIYNIRGLLDEVNIMNKEFYVVVPLFIKPVTKETLFSKFGSLLKPNQDVSQGAAQFEQNKRDLLQRTNLVAQGLAQMGIRAVVLSTQELVELFYTAYNIDEAPNQPLINASDLTTALVVEGPRPEGARPSAAQNVGGILNEPAPPDMFEQARQDGVGQIAAAGPSLNKLDSAPAAQSSGTNNYAAAGTNAQPSAQTTSPQPAQANSATEPPPQNPPTGGAA